MSLDSLPLLKQIHWLGHASFRIEALDGGPVIYVDPWRLPQDSVHADIILVSHEHHDHCSPEDIAMIRTPDTIVVANPPAAEILGAGTIVLRAWQSAPTIGGLTLRAVPAYSLEKPSHAKENGGLGFTITFRDHSVLYFAGDTDLIPEMDRVQCDVALLPVGGGYTMTVEEAAEAAHRLAPQVAIPMHFGSGSTGASLEGSLFCSLLKPPVEGVLLPNESKPSPVT